MNVLLLLALPEAIRIKYQVALKKRYPQLTIDLVEHHSKVDPYIGSAEVLITFGAHMVDHVLEKGVRLKWIQALGTGVDGICDRPALREGVIVTNLHGLHGESMSESALLSMLALARDLPRNLRSQAHHAWDRFTVRLLSGRTVGILGVGAIAKDLAPRCKALGMTVIGITSTKRELPGFDRMVSRDQLQEVGGEVDFLVLLTPYSRETHNIVNADVLRTMKRDSFLINLARGGVVDEAALVDALKNGTIAGAALDVFAKEPLAAEHPFWDMPNVIITPHLGGFHDQYAEKALPVIEENLDKFLAGDTKSMSNVVKR